MLTKKKRIAFATTAVCLIALILVLVLHVGVAGEPWMAGGSVCVSWDKWALLRADKIVLAVDGETYTITNADLVRAIAEDTLAGTYTDYCCAQEDDGWMEIYRGDRLLRRMRYISNHDAFAYEADGTHWVLFGNEGHAFLSKDTAKKLKAVTEK